MKKVMLPINLKSTSDLNPREMYVVMPKIDGIRFRVEGGKLMSRTNKLLPNVQIQEMFCNLEEGMEGELVFGNEYESNFEKTSSIVMSKDKNPEGIIAVLFDRYVESDGDLNYYDRFVKYSNLLFNQFIEDNIKIIEYVTCSGSEIIKQIESDGLEISSAEGSIIRSLNSMYKQGRATAREGTFFKVKKHQDAEALVVGIEQLMKNNNELGEDETGAAKRSTKKEGMIPMDLVGALKVKNDCGEFNIGSGLNQELRKEFFEDPSKIIGKYVKYKYYELTSKGIPRHPIYLGVRDTIDFI